MLKMQNKIVKWKVDEKSDRRTNLVKLVEPKQLTPEPDGFLAH